VPVSPLEAGGRSAVWVVPGTPLEDGAGWRIWYSAPGDFKPAGVTVTRRGSPVESKQVFQSLEPLEGVKRRMGVLTVTLADPGSAGELHEVSIPEAGTYEWRTLPSTLPEQGLTLLFGSCFWRPGDKEGAYSAAIRELTRRFAPAFQILAGDQVYQDYPPVRPVGNMTKVFADRYDDYWGDPGYQEVLRSSPNLFTCDDHEFWNNYPEKQTWIPHTWDAKRKESALAAQETYHRYQRSANPDGRRYFRLAIPPVSFFVADVRSERDDLKDPKHRVIKDPQWKELEDWATTLQGPGVLALAQPLFDHEGGKTDRSLASFKSDFARLCSVFQKSLTRGDGRDAHDILILTGDIHTGRFATATIIGVPSANVYEFVASPASRVGPFVMKASPKRVPDRFTVEDDDRPSLWQVSDVELAATVDNNVGLVRISRGTNERYRFELELWRIRPHDDRSFWQRMRRKGQPQAPFAPIFRKELQLR
jgi:hypothetical protein